MRTISVQGWGIVLLASLLLGLCIGCGPTAPKREYADVAGKVTYKGEPLKTGTVMFQPSSGEFAAGEIKSDGTYSLKGVVGQNDVMIVSREPTPPGDLEENKKKKIPPPKSFIPESYGTPATPLKFDVKAGQNKADFDLKE
jgi:hypothetical protein